MLYSEVRTKIKTGDMLLYRNHPGGGLRAKIERWFVEHGTASPYVHVGVAWVDHDRVFIMDITTKGCAPRPLSKTGEFDWAPAPAELSESALVEAFDYWGELQYSRWQAILGEFGLLAIGKDRYAQCAEYALMIWRASNMMPTTVATPSACADGALTHWKSAILHIEQDT